MFKVENGELRAGNAVHGVPFIIQEEGRGRHTPVFHVVTRKLAHYLQAGSPLSLTSVYSKRSYNARLTPELNIFSQGIAFLNCM